MTALVACINAYNEAEVLPRTLFYAHKLFDKFVLADGAYLSRGKKPHSSDKTNQIFRKYERDGPLDLVPVQRKLIIDAVGKDQAYEDYAPKPTTRLIPDTFWQNEVHKRNAMLYELEPNDWYCYMDAEWLPNFLPSEIESIRTGSYDSHTINIFRASTQARLRYPNFGCFKNHRGVHFLYNHYTLALGDGSYVWDNEDWINNDEDGLLYQEVIRADHEDRFNYKKTQFEMNRYYELSNGMGQYSCASCHYLGEVDPDKKLIIGFNLPRGRPVQCPRCKSGLLENPNFLTVQWKNNEEFWDKVKKSYGDYKLNSHNS